MADEQVFFLFLRCFADDVEDFYILFQPTFSVPVTALLACFVRRTLVRNPNYFERLVPEYQLDEFKSHFRLEKGTFEALLRVVVQTGYLLQEPYIRMTCYRSDKIIGPEANEIQQGFEEIRGFPRVIGHSGYPLLRYLIICFNKELEDFKTYLI